MPSIVHDFRSMDDFKTKEKPPLSIDFTTVRHEINQLLRAKLTVANGDMLAEGLDKILPGTNAQT